MSVHSLVVADSGRLRAVWRIGLFLMIAIFCVGVANQLAALVLRAEPGLVLTGGIAPVLAELTLVAGLLAASAIMLRWVDPRGWSFLGLARSDAEPGVVSFGAVLGAATIGLATGVLLMAREYVFVPAVSGDWLGATARATLILIPAALWEELIFRGYPFAVLQETAGWKWALAITAFTFGLVHVGNPGATAEAIIVVVVAGYFLGLVRIVTGSLYAAWAAHFAWNWVMACGFHVAVSGSPFEHPDYAIAPRGPDWLTGGIWGPEGGLAAGLALFVAVFFLYGRYLKPGGAPAGALDRHD